MDVRSRSILIIFGSFVNVFPGVFATEQHLLTVIYYFLTENGSRKRLVLPPKKVR